MSINAAPQAANLFNISAPPNVAENTIFNPQGGSEGRPFKKEKNDSMFWILLGADAIGFLVWRRRKQQGG